MIKELIKLSNHLDRSGLRQEADRLDLIINKMAAKSRRPGYSWDPGKKWREHNRGDEEHTGEGRELEITEELLREVRESQGMSPEHATLLDKSISDPEPGEVFGLPPEDTTPDSEMEQIALGDDEFEPVGQLRDETRERLASIEERLMRIEEALSL